IYASLSDTTPEQVIAEYAGAGWGTFKPALADLAVAKLSPISTEMKRLMDDPAEIDRTLAKGADKARAIAQPILAQTKEIIGLLSS
ncbi:MAG: tryptophan--tRNA ligase, partial [Octadecabacter sp.]|nr:tryptophan--tRNA ligase [Octadecabacter sp.]